MKKFLVLVCLYFGLTLFVKGQLNYHLGIQFPYTEIKNTQLNVGYDFMKEDKLHFGLYSGYQLINNKDNINNQTYTFYRFPFGIKYYFKPKQEDAGYAPFAGFNFNISPLIKQKSGDRVFLPEITNIGFGITLGTKVFLVKRWEILVAGNYNFDFYSAFPKDRNYDNILFEDSGIFISLGYNFNLKPNAK